MLSERIDSFFYSLWDRKERRLRDRERATLERTQWLSPEELKKLQLTRLRAIVGHAYATVPYYRERWGHAPRITRLEDLRQLPLLTKRDIRGAAERLVSERYSREQLVESKTGGSTGVPLKLYFDADCQQTRNAAAMRSDGWAGWRPGQWTGSLWGSPPLPRTFKERLRNLTHDRTVFLDTMDLRPETMDAFTAELHRRRASVLFGHAHSIFMYARYLEERGIEPPAVSSIISTSMMLLAPEREVIERVFRCQVSNRYGCEEVGLIASECERHQGLHINEEHLVVELLDADGNPVKPGEEGRVVLTDLMNLGMPLIRYEVEDVAVLRSEPCVCGRGLGVLDRIVGRQADFLRHRDGRLVAGVSLVEKTATAIPGIEQMQIVQHTLDVFTLNVVPSPSYSPATAEELQKVIRSVFGNDVEVKVAVVGSLSPEENGKYRFSICRISDGRTN